jgi:hypothetical protein
MTGGHCQLIIYILRIDLRLGLNIHIFKFKLKFCVSMRHPYVSPMETNKVTEIWF